MIGSHLARRTWLHALSARLKLLALAALTVIAFWIDSSVVLAAGFLIVLLVYVCLGSEARTRLKLFSSLAPLLIVIALFQYWSVGPEAACVTLVRLCLMILLADMVSMSTPMLDMMDAIEPAMRPLAWIGWDASRLSVAIALVIRFVPALLEEWSKRNEAWRARTGRRASIRLLPAFLASIVTMADRVAEALDARGFGRRGR
jgi:biotin transport system permease protein